MPWQAPSGSFTHRLPEREKPTAKTRERATSTPAPRQLFSPATKRSSKASSASKPERLSQPKRRRLNGKLPKLSGVGCPIESLKTRTPGGRGSVRAVGKASQGRDEKEQLAPRSKCWQFAPQRRVVGKPVAGAARPRLADNPAAIPATPLT
jgi:hypothetical protein